MTACSPSAEGQQSQHSPAQSQAGNVTEQGLATIKQDVK